MSAFVKVGEFALKKACESGDGSACKLYFLADPQAAAKADFDQKLAAMNQQLNDISRKLDALSAQLSDLAKELQITGDELKVVIVQSAASTYFNDIQAAFNGLHSLGKTDDIDSFVVSSLTTQGQGWNLPGALAQVHGTLVGTPELTESTAHPGLFAHLDQLLHDKLLGDEPEKKASATAAYELLEEYFGDVLGTQARALLVIAACYNYLDAHPDLKSWLQQEHLLIQTSFQSYVDNVFRPNIEKQVQAFVRSAERLLAFGLDPDASAEELHPEADHVLWRTDFVAGWTRSALLGQAQPLAVVRVVGEPDRVTQLQSLGGYKDGASGHAYQADTSCLPAGSASGVAQRAWPTRAPYIQFPIRSDNRIVRGAATLHTAKYVLADASLSPGERQAVPSQPAAWLPPATFAMQQLDPDGRPTTEAPFLVFGHATVILKETAMCRLAWQPAGEGSAVGTCPQSMTVSLKVSPSRTRKSHCAGGYCWDTY